MKNLVFENLEEYRQFLDNKENIDEGIFDFFKSMRQLVAQAVKNPNDEKILNNALSACFSEKTKDYVLKLDLKQKQGILAQVSKKLEDKTIGILTLQKNKAGQLVVGGKAVSGGATQATTGA